MKASKPSGRFTVTEINQYKVYVRCQVTLDRAAIAVNTAITIQIQFKFELKFGLEKQVPYRLYFLAESIPNQTSLEVTKARVRDNKQRLMV